MKIIIAWFALVIGIVGTSFILTHVKETSAEEVSKQSVATSSAAKVPVEPPPRQKHVRLLESYGAYNNSYVYILKDPKSKCEYIIVYSGDSSAGAGIIKRTDATGKQYCD